MRDYKAHLQIVDIFKYLILFSVKYRVTHEVGGGSKIKAVEGANLQYDCMAIADANPTPPFPSVAQTSGETKNTSRITVTHRRDGKYTVDCLHESCF